MSYMKANVEQVYRYLTAYLSAGGSFPEQLNSKIRNLAAQVPVVMGGSKSLPVRWRLLP
jgi:D-alanine-D-alanine ligase-like ATP-grasp enzyme